MLALWRLDTVIVQRDTARQDASVNAAALVLAEASRTTEQARQGVADAEGAVGYEQIEQARRDADAAGAAAGRLRVEAGRIATQLATCNASTAGERQARVATGDLLADVLGRADDRAGELAAIADRARAAGLTCERVYDGVSGL
ncbi:DUF2514 domain-containing protein [Stutzerimonas kirkiae]|nr:DUF2514 domain-containing protein [Stutzerimonas kirkiae]